MKTESTLSPAATRQLPENLKTMARAIALGHVLIVDRSVVVVAHDAHYDAAFLSNLAKGSVADQKTGRMDRPGVAGNALGIRASKQATFREKEPWRRGFPSKIRY